MRGFMVMLVALGLLGCLAQQSPPTGGIDLDTQRENEMRKQIAADTALAIAVQNDQATQVAINRKIANDVGQKISADLTRWAIQDISRDGE